MKVKGKEKEKPTSKITKAKRFCVQFICWFIIYLSTWKDRKNATQQQIRGKEFLNKAGERQK